MLEVLAMLTQKGSWLALIAWAVVGAVGVAAGIAALRRLSDRDEP